MKKLFFTCILLMMISNPISAVLLEGHGQCVSFQPTIDQLNMDSSQKGEYATYVVLDNYDYVQTNKDNDGDGELDSLEIPTCSFRKSTEGYVNLELIITDQTPFLEVDQKIEALQDKVRFISNSNLDDYSQYCLYQGNSFYVHDTSTSGLKKLTLLGNIYCQSEKDLNFLKNLDFNALLTEATKGTGFSFEIDPPMAPVISGTTIHN